MQAAIFNWQHGEVRNQNKTATDMNIIFVSLTLFLSRHGPSLPQSTSLRRGRNIYICG